MGKKVRIIVSLLVVAIIGILIIPPQDNSNEVITQVIQSDIITSDDINLDQDIIDEAFQAYSIVDTERVFTESDQSLIEKFLDENDLPSSSEKLGVEVQTVLFDSDQKQYPSSNIIGIPELSVYDDQGRVLDLGSIQTSFLAITANTEQSFNLDGTVEFYLDDTLITTKRIYGSDSNKQNHELSIVDSLPNVSFDRPKAFTFTISDEGRDWTHDSEHTYRVVLTQINANIDSNKDYKQFTWTGENVVYELKVKVDEKKKVILDENNSAIKIFKNDSTMQLCGFATLEEIKYKGWTPISQNPPSIIIKDYSWGTVGETIIDESFTPTPAKAEAKRTKHQFGNIYTSSSCSEKFSGIPRNHDILIQLDNNEPFMIHTPKTQFNYYINANPTIGSFTHFTPPHIDSNFVIPTQVSLDKYVGNLDCKTWNCRGQ